VELRLLSLHALAVKSAGSADSVALLLGCAPEEVEQALEAAAADGHTAGAKGTFMVTPAGRSWLDARYPDAFAAFRQDASVQAAAARFERMNRDLLALLSDWQSVPMGAERVPNTHADGDYDRRILDRLGDLHERAAKVLDQLAGAEPRLKQYARRLDDAYDQALAGKNEFVSGVRVDSYHVVWHELHEDLLRMLGHERET
jgi:hypothetical protein